MQLTSRSRSTAAEALGRLGFLIGIFAVACLIGVCVVESGILINPDQIRSMQWILIFSLMIALNVPTIVVAMRLGTVCDTAATLAMVVYLSLSCLVDIYIFVEDYPHPSVAQMAVVLVFPIFRPMVMFVLYCIGTTVDRFYK